MSHAILLARDGDRRGLGERLARIRNARLDVLDIDYSNLVETDIDWSALDERTRLSAPLEAHLFRQFNLAKYQAANLRQHLQTDQPDPAAIEEVERLCVRADRVRNHLMLVYRKLALSIARHFVNQRHSLEELQSESELTMLRALEKFNPDRGFRFSTYATHAVRRRLLRYLQTQLRDRERLVTVQEGPIVVDSRRWTLNYERQVMRRIELAERLIRELAPRERYILRARFGWGQEFEPRTLQQIADELEISRERVRQLEKRALGRLQQLAEKEERRQGEV